MEASRLTDEEFEQLLDEEACALEPGVWAIYDRYATPPTRMTYSWAWDGRSVSKTIWVIARAGARVLGYDEVEEEFGTGARQRDGRRRELGHVRGTPSLGAASIPRGYAWRAACRRSAIIGLTCAAPDNGSMVAGARRSHLMMCPCG